MPYTAKINGTAVNVVAGTLSVTNQIGQRSQGALSVWGPLGTTWQYGTQIQIYDETSALAYSGYISKDKAYRAPGSRQGVGYLEHDLTLMDNNYRADKRRVFKSYLLTSAGSIVKALWGAYLQAEGVTYTAHSIAAGLTITQVIWDGTKSVADALTWLATQCGYWWQIDSNGVLWFQPYWGVAAPVGIDGTNVDSMQDFYIESGNDMYVNYQYVKGAYAETTQVHTETFHGDGTRRNWTISYELSTLVQLTLNGVDVTSQTLDKGTNGGLFYAAVGDAVIAQDPGQSILTSGDTLVVRFKGRFPVLSSAQNKTLIAAQKAREGGIGTGRVESIFENSKVRSLTAGMQIASAMLAHYGADATILNFSTQTKGFIPGQQFVVNLPDFGLSAKTMLISSVQVSDQNDGFNIWFTVQAVGSPVEVAQWQTYWANLMAQSSDPSDYTDTGGDTSLATLSTSAFSHTPSLAVTLAKYSCPIVGNATIIGNSLIIC